MTSQPASRIQPSRLSLRALTFDDCLVMALVLALFFEEPEDSLWLRHGFPIPNVVFVGVGAVLIGRVAFLASRGRFDLGKPSWRELTIIGLFAIWGVTAVAAALLGHAHPNPHNQPLILVSHLGQSIKTFAHFGYLAFITLILGRFLTPALLRRAIATFFALAVAAAVVACLQALDQNVLHTGATGALHLISRDAYTGQALRFIRPCSVFSEPAYLGYYMLIAVICGLWLARASRSRWIWLGIGLCIVAALLGAAAGPAVAFFVGFVYLLLRAWPVLRRSWRELAVVGVAAIAVLVFLPVGQTLSNRASGIGSHTDPSAQLRTAVDHASVHVWQLSPFTGVGLGNSRYYTPSLVHLGFKTSVQIDVQGVNSYLEALSESGIFGFLALIVVLPALLLPLGRVRREGAWVTETPILLFIVAGFFVSSLALPVFWFFAGDRLAQIRHLERPEDSEGMAA